MFYFDAALLKLYIFKYEQNNNRLLKIYKNKQADTHYLLKYDPMHFSNSDLWMNSLPVNQKR